MKPCIARLLSLRTQKQSWGHNSGLAALGRTAKSDWHLIGIILYSPARPLSARSWGVKVNPHTTGRTPNSLQVLLENENTLDVFERLVPQMEENRRSVL
jgi:hypothetical protein